MSGGLHLAGGKIRTPLDGSALDAEPSARVCQALRAAIRYREIEEESRL
jgi:hypothetical protein